jgi:uncharacterized hydrophobic protein (TIGR00341 family)
MQQRVVKVILPVKQKVSGLELLDADEGIFYWLEESNSVNVVISILADSGQTESLMDKFERGFGKTDGFKLIVLPVEASIPRKKEEVKPEPESVVKAKEKKSPRISREELYADIVGSTEMSNIYIIFVILSTIVAAIGLMKDNVAVIIGAMVIAPFLGPSVALALSATLGDNKLRNNALRATIAGFSLVIFLSSAIGFFFTVDPDIPEIASRTQTGISDILLALASGAAGVLAFTTGAPAVVIGVMVAVALLPPLTVFGLLMGSGEYNLAAGAFLLFLTNIICINLAGVTTFLFQGVSPRTWWEAKKAKKASRKTLAIWIITLGLLVVIILLWSK